MKSSQAKIFDFTLLKQKLSEQENVMMAFVFGSAKGGEQIKPDSDVDIAVWLKEPPTLDDRLFLLGLCQETLQYDNRPLSKVKFHPIKSSEQLPLLKEV